VEAIDIEIGGDDHGGAAGVDAAGWVGGLGLPKLVVGEQVCAVVSALLEAGMQAGVGSVVGDVAGAIPGAEAAGRSWVPQAPFGDAQKLVAVGQKTKPERVAVQGGFL